MQPAANSLLGPTKASSAAMTFEAVRILVSDIFPIFVLDNPLRVSHKTTSYQRQKQATDTSTTTLDDLPWPTD
jgi:hypothetical protein